MEHSTNCILLVFCLGWGLLCGCATFTADLCLAYTERPSGNHMISDNLGLNSPLRWIWLWSGRKIWQHLEWSPQALNVPEGRFLLPPSTSREGETWKIGSSDPIPCSTPDDCSTQCLLIQGKFLHIGIAHENRESWATSPFWVNFVFLKPPIKDPDLGSHNSIQLSPSLTWDQRS